MDTNIKKKLIFWGVISGIVLLFIIIIASLGASISHKNKQIKELKIELTIKEKELSVAHKQKVTEDKIDKDFNINTNGGEDLNENDKKFFNDFFHYFNNYVIQLPKSSLSL